MNRLFASTLVTLALVSSALGVATPATSVAPSASSASAATASDNDPFCVKTSGYCIWSGLTTGIVALKGYFNDQGEFCKNVKNITSRRRGVALDVGSSLGRFHRVPAGKKRTVCRSVADKRLRVSLRVRMRGDFHQPAGTWLIAKTPAKRVVTVRKVPTKNDPNVKLCARNTMKRKAMLFMFMGEAQVDKTDGHIKPGKIGCVGIGLDGPLTATMKAAWMNPYGARGVEAWVVRN
ncbi:hypothetical protein KDA23_01755 [Candidatus Saccharibacteria bacterium]|nr:hypothetical protein [Candidatus Saccharibacteria bacterium]